MCIRDSAKKKRTVILRLPVSEAKQKLEWLKSRHQTARARLLEALLEEPSLPYEVVTGSLKVTASVLRAMEEQGILSCESEHIYRTPSVLQSLKEESEGNMAGTPPQGNMAGTPLQGSMAGTPLQGSMAGTSLQGSMAGTPLQGNMAGTPLQGKLPESPSAEMPSGNDTSAVRQTGQPSAVQAQAGGFTLNEEQQAIVDAVRREWESEEYAQYLIHGVTGSGKTAVYMELILSLIHI